MIPFRDPSGSHADVPRGEVAGSGPPTASGPTIAPEIFGEALELHPEARIAYLERVCAGDSALRTEVESLLAAHAAGAPAFFRRPLQITSSGEILTELFGGVADGTRIGPYRTIKLVASGGMGAVYLAERTDGAFHMRVAIKLVHPALWGTDALLRFRKERQVLADLEHPGIARLVDGGSTAGDVPYLVMEYIEGVPIDRYCEDHGLDIRARLALFLEICGAVQYAHQNLVIHRDLKPSNILVDGSGRVKLLDFGIAKVLAGEGAPEAQDPTVTRNLLTPRYASPEQVLARRLTTATDIYSLGVVLYELLTRRFPYDIDATPAVDVVQVISREEPIPPSRRVADAQVARRLEGDVDTIVLKTLQKDPARRYATVDDFATDIRRHLEGLPVQARPDTAAYRVSKFVARHKALVGGTVAAVVAIITALVVIVAAYRQATAAKRELEWQVYVTSLAATEASIRADKIEEAASHLDAAPAHLRGWEWWHLRARIDRSIATFRAHRSRITRMVFTRDGHLVTASIDSTIKIWNGTSGQLMRPYGPFTSEVESISILDGTPFVAVGLRDGRVLLLDETNGIEREIHPAGGGRDGVPGYAFVSVNPDHSRLACGFFDGTVHVWTLTDGSPVAEWKVDLGLALPVYSSDGKLLAIGGGTGAVTLYDAHSNRRLFAFRPHRSRVYRMAFSPGDSMLVTASMDGSVCMWSVNRREVVHTFRDHRGTPSGIAFDPLGRSVLTGAGDGRIICWSATTGSVLGEYRGHFKDIAALAAHPDGVHVASADWDGFVKLWDYRTEDVRTLRAGIGWLVPAFYDVALAAGEELLSMATNAGEIRTWDLKGAPVRSMVVPSDFHAVLFWPDSDMVLVGHEDGQIRLYGYADQFRVVASHRGPVLGMALHASGGMLATCSADSSIRLWRVPGMQPIRTLEGHRGAVEDVEFSPQGTLLATCGADSTIRVWDFPSGRSAGTLEDGGPVQRIAFDPSGRRLASASLGGGLRIWDLRSMHQVGAPGHHDKVLSVAWSRDGTRIAAGGVDGILRLYDVPSGHEVMSLHGHISGITSLHFCRADSLLISTSLDGTLRIWDSQPTGAHRAAFRR